MPEQMTKQDAIEYLLYMKHDVQAKSPMDIALDTAIEALRQPTIEPEVRHGAWIAVSMFDACGGDEEVWMAHGNPIAYHYCSECKEEAYVNEEGKEILSDYCPFCGAKLRGVLEDEGTD